MKTRFVQRYRDGEVVYHPGMSADHLSDKQLKKLVKEGIVAEMAQPEVQDDVTPIIGGTIKGSPEFPEGYGEE